VIRRSSEPSRHAPSDRPCAERRPVSPRARQLRSNAPADAPKIVEALVSPPCVRRSTSPARPRSARISSHAGVRSTLRRCCSSSAAKRRSWCSTSRSRQGGRLPPAFGRLHEPGQICMSTERLLSTTARRRLVANSRPGEQAAGRRPREHSFSLAVSILHAAEKMDALIADCCGKAPSLVSAATQPAHLLSDVLEHVTPGHAHLPGGLLRVR